MEQTRKELLDDFLQFVGESGDVEARNVAERVLNRALESIWQHRRWRDYYSPAKFEILLVVNQRSYALPDYFGRLGEGRVMNLTTGCPLTVWTPAMLEEQFPQTGTSFERAASPQYAVIGGVSGVVNQPNPNGEALEVVSSDPDDVDVSCTVVGDDLFGRTTRLHVDLNGITPVPAGTWGYVDEFGKSYNEAVTPVTELTSSRGTVTLSTVAASTILQVLYPQESAHEHKIITFYPKPSSAHTVAVPVMRRAKRLLYDSDVTPGDWRPAIFEEMVIQWKLNTGEITLDTASAAPRPALINLVMLENSLEPRPRVRPFGAVR